MRQPIGEGTVFFQQYQEKDADPSTPAPANSGDAANQTTSGTQCSRLIRCVEQWRGELLRESAPHYQLGDEFYNLQSMEAE